MDDLLAEAVAQPPDLDDRLAVLHFQPIELKKTASELGLGRGDDRVRPYIDKIPGAGR